MIESQCAYVDGHPHPVQDVSDALADLRKRRNGFVWISLADPNAEELAEMNHELGLHSLVVEDLTSPDQRPKIEHYESGTLVSLKTLRVVTGPGGLSDQQVETGQVQIFVGDRFLLVVRQGDLADFDRAVERAKARPERLAHGPMVAAHAVLDWVVDGYQEVSLALDAAVIELEDRVFDPGHTVDGMTIYRLKREVLEARIATSPLLPALTRLVRPEASDPRLVDKQLLPYFRDVLDHLSQVVEQVEAFKRQLSDVLGAHLAAIGVQQNEDMRKISAWVAMAAVPTMVAGIYGMNFDHMPELHQRWGYPAVLCFMALVMVVLYAIFKRHKWL